MVLATTRALSGRPILPEEMSSRARRRLGFNRPCNPDGRRARTRRAGHLFRLRGVAAERRLAVDRFAGRQCGQDELAVSGYLDGDGDDIDPVVADHRERIGEPTLGTKGFSRLTRALLVARCHGGERQGGKTCDCRNVGHRCPACFGVCTYNADAKCSLAHDCFSCLSRAFLPKRAVARY
jgi:hypothetical protein